MGHAGGEVSDAGQPFRSDQISAGFGDFSLKLVVEAVQLFGHPIEVSRERGDFIVTAPLRRRWENRPRAIFLTLPC